MDAIARLGVSLEGRRPEPGEARRQENRSYSQVGTGIYIIQNIMGGMATGENMKFEDGGKK